MKTVTKIYNLYTYDELDDKAKEKAIAWFSEEYPNYDWWNCTYEDAETIGLKITSFDLERNRHAEGKFIEYADTVAELILENHGAMCETYKTAQEYLATKKSLDEKYTQDQKDSENEYDGELEDLKDEFLKSLLEDYSIMLQKEYEYLTSREHIEETIQINEYTFDENGKRTD